MKKIDEFISWPEIHKMAKEAQDIEEELDKGRIYLKPGEKPPKGARVQRGLRGGMFYEPTSDVETKITRPEPHAGRPTTGQRGPPRLGLFDGLVEVASHKTTLTAQQQISAVDELITGKEAEMPPGDRNRVDKYKNALKREINMPKTKDLDQPTKNKVLTAFKESLRRAIDIEVHGKVDTSRFGETSPRASLYS